MHGSSRTLFLVALLAGIFLVGPASAVAESTLRGDLPRQNNRPLEATPGLDTVYDVLVTRDGTRLRTILTKPAGHAGRLPAILFVQWLSCDTIELSPTATDGWSQMLRRVARESGLVVMRTEKRGVGDSQGGPCSALDYLTELSDHRDALEKLKASEFVDPTKIVVFGASMGATYAPLMALGQRVAGVVVWGGGAKTWFERMMTFERQYRELSGVSGEALTNEMKDVTAFLYAYLVEKKSPRQIAAENARLGAVWSKLVGTEGELHYGRPIAFHQQVQEQNWAAAWSQLDAPALVLYGEYDWFEDAAGHALIARLVNQRQPGRARFRVVANMDHHFTLFAQPEDAVRDLGGVVGEGPVVQEILAWLKTVLAR